MALVPAAGAVKEEAPIVVGTRYATERVEFGEIEKVESFPRTDGVSTLAVCPTSAAPEILTSGVPSEAGNDTTTADCHYKINVAAPAGLRLRAVVSWVGLSDHDVYVKQGSPATVSPYYCSETGVSQTSPATCSGGTTLVAGDYFLRVKRWNGATDFVLTVFLEVPPPPPPTCSLGTGTTPLLDNVPVTAALSTDAGAACQFVFSPSPTQDVVQVTMNPAPSDFDLYVRKGSAPTTSLYDCRPYLGGSASETCTLPNDGTDVYITVLRFSGSGAFTVSARAFSPCSFGNVDAVLSEGVAETASLSADAGAACFFKFEVAPGFDLADVTMTPATGDYDLFLKIGSRPTTSSYGCASVGIGTVAESCKLGADVGQVVYAMVIRFSGSGDFTISAVSASSCSLGPGIHPLAAGANTASLLGVANAKCLFSYAPGASADFTSYVMPATTPNDFDIYVRSGDLPTTTLFDCRPYLGGSSAEVCDVLADGPQFVMVRRFSGPVAGGAFTVTVSDVIVPVLENGIPVLANAAAGSMTYYKVVLPSADDLGYAPTQLAIATLGDMTGAACANVDTTAGPGTCLLARNADATTCAAIDQQNPGSCAGAYTAAADACTEVNNVNPGTCTGAPDVLVGVPNVDLYVRHRAGLPTTLASNCKGTGAGSTETCVFSSEATQAAADARATYTQARTDVWAEVGPNCPDPTVCGANPLPAFPATSNVVPFLGAGKYFIGVRGTTGPADYAVVATWV